MSRIERTEHFEDDAARRWRRHRINFVALIAAANRVAPVGMIFCEIVGADDSAMRFHEFDKSLCDFAVIETRGRIITETLQRRCEILRDDRVAGLRCGAVGLQENLAQSGIAFQLRREDRKSTRLNSSHSSTSYAVF